MSLNIGIIGLPNVGKSTLFNALLKRQAALAANYPFATIEPNVGVVDVPDKNLEKLYDLMVTAIDTGREKAVTTTNEKGEHITKLPQKMPAVVKFYDIAGLVKDAHKGEGLGNQFLSHIREADALIHVVRDFSDENVVRAGSTTPENDIELINMELIFADIQTLESRLNSKKYRQDAQFIQRLTKALEGGKLLNELDLTDDEAAYIKELNLLTQKPMFFVVNVDESRVGNQAVSENAEAGIKRESALQKGVGENKDFIRICAKIEAELADFNEEEKQEYLKGLGIKESGLDKVIRKSYEKLSLQTYYTAGPKEVRAWTIKKGMRAPQAAGVIHTDFERGFIKAEIISLKDLEKVGDWKSAKDAGLMRLEGKDYIMQPEDVVVFKFNV